MALLKLLSVNPAMFRSNTSNIVCGVLPTVTNPLKLVNVTDPVELNVWFPIRVIPPPG
jgi:hypothetical protein